MIEYLHPTGAVEVLLGDLGCQGHSGVRGGPDGVPSPGEGRWFNSKCGVWENYSPQATQVRTSGWSPEWLALCRRLPATFLQLGEQ